MTEQRAPIRDGLIATHLTITPGDHGNGLRKGDVLPNGRVIVGYDSTVSRGANKGHLRYTVEGGYSPETFDPAVPVQVTRYVADGPSREAYRIARREFHDLADVVRAYEDLDKAVDTLRSYTDKALDEPTYRPMGNTVLRDAPAQVEIAAERFRTMFQVHGRALEARGFDLATIVSLGKGGALRGDLYAHHPAAPLNMDCYLDGTPSGQGTSNVAPLFPPIESPEA